MATVFGILTYGDVEPIDIGATYGVLSMARRVIPEIEMFTVAPEAGDIALTNGLHVRADYGFRECPPLDVLIVLGGSGWQMEARRAETLEFIRQRAGEALTVSVCTGALILAAAGLLDGRHATTRRHALAGDEVPLQLLGAQVPGVNAEEAVFVDSGDVITGGGVTLAIDTTLHVIERLFGAEATAEVSRLIDYATAREANAAALGTTHAP